MKCNRCGYELEEGTRSCPKCGTRVETMEISNEIKLHEPYRVKESKKENPFMTAVLVFLTVCICFGGFYLYKKYASPKEEEMTLLESRVLDYKVKGYTITEVDNNVQELDRFNIVNADFDYSTLTTLNIKSSKACNTLKREINYTIEDGLLTISSGNYSKTVDNISAKYILDFNRKTCECSDYNVAVLSRDGYVYLMEMDEVNLEGEKLVNYIANGFVRLNFNNNKVVNFGVSSFVGETNPCGEKVVVVVDEYETKHYYRNEEFNQISETYSLRLYNIVPNDEDTILYINPDRTMEFKKKDDNISNFLIDSNGERIKYYGILKSGDGLETYVLSTIGMLYQIDFSNENSYILNPVRSLMVKNIGYKYNMNTSTAIYAIIFEDGSSKEYIGSYESYGFFSIQ